MAVLQCARYNPPIPTNIQARHGRGRSAYFIHSRGARRRCCHCANSLLEIKEKSLRFVHEMTNDETKEVIARTTLKAVHLDTEERRSCVFAGEIAAKVASMLPNNSNQEICNVQSL